MIFELHELAKRAFIHKLKEANPNISPKEITEAVNRWYKDRPEAPLGDGVGHVGDLSRFR